MKAAIGKMLKRERRKSYSSQKEIGDKINADKQYISNVENGHKNLTIEQLEQIVNAIGCTHEDIFKL